MKGALVLILCMVVASIGIEVEVLEDTGAFRLDPSTYAYHLPVTVLIRDI